MLGKAGLGIAFRAKPIVRESAKQAISTLGLGIAAPSRDLMVRSATPSGSSGRVYGIVYSGIDLGAALSPLIFGIFLDGGLPKLLFVGVALLQLMIILTGFKVSTFTAAKSG